ncbi:hypothetical protein [Pseudoduganella namucuonensis]|uniref:hypothetical protein n=1 Tax=Pseudoduganella namucuonensis TaxID=1035707 RepID=UPI00116082A1|nr:hypothetical protein [Pseudoduganella namucuonensis]
MLKCADAGHNGLGRKFCTAGVGTRADFAIARFNRPPFEPAATCGPAAAPPSPHVECKEMQYQYDFQHPCNVFAIRAISVLIPGLSKQQADRSAPHLFLEN